MNDNNMNMMNNMMNNNGGVYPYYHLPTPYFQFPGNSASLAMMQTFQTPKSSENAKMHREEISPDMILCAQQLKELYQWGTSKTPAGKNKSGYYYDMHMGVGLDDDDVSDDEGSMVTENTNSVNSVKNGKGTPSMSHGKNSRSNGNTHKTKRRLYRGLSQDTVGTEGTIYDDLRDDEDDHNESDTDRESLNGSYSTNSTNSSAGQFNNHNGFHSIMDGPLVSSLANKNKKKKSRASKESTSVLNEWFLAHLDNPYPTYNEKLELSRKSGLNLSQCNNWFGNRRIRYKRKHANVTYSKPKKQKGRKQRQQNM